MKRTTIRLDDELMDQVRREAERRNATVTSLLEQGLRLLLAQSQSRVARARVVLPVSPRRGGVLPGVDLDDSASLLDIIEGRK
jgi:Ribbon-helix-helix protein, copG family